MKHSQSSKVIDITFLILSPIFAFTFSLLLKTDLMTTTLLFFGIPAVYLSFRNTHAVVKSLIFSLLCGLFMAFVIDYFAVKSGSWFVTRSYWRLLDVVPIEDLIWGFLMVYGIIMFYEHLLDKGKHNLKDTKLKYGIVIAIVLATIFLLIYFFTDSLFYIPYFYLKAGVVLVLLPTVSFLTFFPRLLSKFVKAGVFFFIQALLIELTGLTLNQWEFKGNQMVGWVTLLNLKFPFEEFFFYIILFSTCILSYYEFFYDDSK